MAGKGKGTVRIEAEIEKCREESNWKKVIELAEQLRTRSPGCHESLANFLIGEGKMELYLEDNPPTEQNMSKAKTGLGESKRYLMAATSEQGKKVGVALDAHLLLGKLQYAMGAFEESLNHYNLAELESLSEKQLPSRSLRIVAESYAITGLCLEKLPPTSTSKFRQAEWGEKMVHCFEVAGDLALLYLQEIDKLQQSSQNSLTISGTHTIHSHGSARQVGPILETALQRAPILHIQAGKLQSAISRYRTMLSAVESSATQSLRLTLTRQLAEVLLRGVSGSLYTSPLSAASPAPKKLERKGSPVESPWKPKRYTGTNLFVPKNENEEIILLLLISEAMAVRDAVLSQSPEFKEVRIHAYDNATAVYDLLTIATVRWNQVTLLCENFEHAMKFSHEEPHVWMQYGLSLFSAGRHSQAFLVLKECARHLPNKVMPCLLLARILYEHLNMIDEGLQWSIKALARETANPQNLASRCHLYVGIGYSIKASSAHLKNEKQTCSVAALDSFLKAQQCDPNDHLVAFYLALQYACSRQLTEALAQVRVALGLRGEFAPSLHLLALLLSASKQPAEALQLVNASLEEFPDNLNILYLKAHLELQYQGGDIALLTAKHMLALWKVLHEEQTNMEHRDQFDSKSDTRSVFQLYSSEMSDKDSSSLHAQSLVASRVEHALSEVASSLSSFPPRPGPPRAWLLQLQVWLLLSEIYLALDQPSAAAACLQEAATIFPLSHQIMHMRGLLHEYKQEYQEAKLCFQNAVAINPTHIKSLQHLGLVYHYLGSHRQAEKTLRDAAKIDPHSHQTWYNLGKVLEALSECEAASDCMATALEVETTSPILPFSSIPLCFE